MLRSVKLFFLIILSCVHFNALAKNSKASTETFSLENGLKVIVKPDHRAPVVLSQVWYKVGSAYEPMGLTGISHVMEHMMFKGTRKHGPGEFSRIIAENGGTENAFTNTDYTAYFQQVAKDRLPICLEMEADRMQHLKLDNREFKKELEVVKEERRMRVDDKPTSVTFERFLAAAHIGSPYHHMPIGWMNDLNHLELADVKRWYANWYRPNNAVLVVVGDVEPKAVYQLAKKYFGHIPAGPVKPLKPHHYLPGLGVRHVDVKRPAKLPYVLIGYNVPSIKTIKDPKDVYTLDVISSLLNGASGRLERELIRGDKVAVSVGASYDLYSLFDTLFVLQGLPAEDGSLEKIKQAFAEQVNRLKKGDINQAELDRVKQELVASKVYERDSIFYQGMQIGILETIGLPHTMLDEYLPSVRKVTAQDIQRVANQYFSNEQMTVAELKPQQMVQTGGAS